MVAALKARSVPAQLIIKRGGGHPWATIHEEVEGESRLHRTFERLMGPFLDRDTGRRARIWLYGGTVAIIAVAMLLVVAQLVVLKMLPFDNKSEFQVIVDMPEGTSIEQTARALDAMAESIERVPEVTDYQVYAGTASPINFNGLVRHYFLRTGPLVADLQVNLLPKHHRDQASHPFAKELRELLLPVVEGTGANVKVTEVPPGPPVQAPLVAEISLWFRKRRGIAVAIVASGSPVSPSFVTALLHEALRQSVRFDFAAGIESCAEPVQEIA